MSESGEVKTSVGQVVSKMTVTLDGVTIPVVPAKFASNRLGYSRRHMNRLCDEGELIAIKICGVWFIHELEIETRLKMGVLEPTA